MKKLIILLTISSLFFSCSNNSNSNNANNNNNNSSNGNVNYYFKIKINGVEHKVQGNTSGFAVGNNNSYQSNPNLCQATIGTTTQLNFKIADITYPNYVSGQNLQMVVYIPNCHLGLNQASVYINPSPVLDAFTSSSVVESSNWVENSGWYCTSGGCQGYPLWSTYNNKITLNITDMGTPSQMNTGNSGYPFNYGNTFKGSFNGPIYFHTGPIVSNINSVNFNIPMQFSMEFEAYRIN